MIAPHVATCDNACMSNTNHNTKGVSHMKQGDFVQVVSGGFTGKVLHAAQVYNDQVVLQVWHEDRYVDFCRESIDLVKSMTVPVCSKCRFQHCQCYMPARGNFGAADY